MVQVMKPSQALQALANAIRETGETACMTTDPEAWFPEGGMPTHENRMAVKLCNACPVQRECLAYALADNTPYGIFGGLYPRERSALKRKSPPVRTGTPKGRNNKHSQGVFTA
jgi:hypothetical protein